MNSKFKKIIGICLSMVLAFSLALPAYAKQPDYEFDEETGHLAIGKDIKNKKITDIVPIPKDEIKSVTIKDGVKKIGEDAFSGCTGLTSVTIGNSVKEIGSSAFKGCKGLTSITIPSSVTSIGRRAFSGCTGLTSINVDEGSSKYKSIDGVLFSKDGTKLIKYPEGKKATNYSIPDSVKSIGEYAFEGCTGLTSVTIGNGVKKIYSGAFKRCTGLTSVYIPNSVTSIGFYAFQDCTGLTSVTIGNGVTSIGQYAFYVCTNLKEVTIPKKLDITDVFNEYVKINRI